MMRFFHKNKQSRTNLSRPILNIVANTARKHARNIHQRRDITLEEKYELLGMYLQMRLYQEFEVLPKSVVIEAHRLFEQLHSQESRDRIPPVRRNLLQSNDLLTVAQ